MQDDADDDSDGDDEDYVEVDDDGDDVGDDSDDGDVVLNNGVGDGGNETAQSISVMISMTVKMMTLM